jgi:NADPH:quinone reductase-like Zn-dependent oxidoreductase
VTAVAGAANLGWVKDLGAVRIIDYNREDFTDTGDDYDVIFDAVGKLDPLQAKKALKPGGEYVSVASTTSESLENLLTLKAMIEAGALTPVIDRVYPLAEIVEAHRYVESGRKKGNVVIAVTADAEGVSQR